MTNMNPIDAVNGAALLKVFGFAFGAELQLVSPDKLRMAFVTLDKVQVPADRINLVDKIKANIGEFIAEVKATKKTVKDKDPKQWEDMYKVAMEKTKAFSISGSV